jgi:hypothetical protein
MTGLKLTDEQIEEYLSLHHWIPAKRGLLGAWLDENVYRGANDGAVLDALERQGRIECDSGSLSGYRLVSPGDVPRP